MVIVMRFLCFLHPTSFKFIEEPVDLNERNDSLSNDGEIQAREDGFMQEVVFWGIKISISSRNLLWQVRLRA